MAFFLRFGFLFWVRFPFLFTGRRGASGRIEHKCYAISLLENHTAKLWSLFFRVCLRGSRLIKPLSTASYGDDSKVMAAAAG